MSLEQANNGSLMWKIAGSLIIVVTLAGSYMWLNSTAPTDSSSMTPLQNSVHSKAPTTNQAPVVIQETSPAPTHEPADQVLVQDTILQDQVPTQAALAKEEIAKLDDIQQQLVDQQNTLEAQQADADQLIKLKEEQIKLLEQQLSAKG